MKRVIEIFETPRFSLWQRGKKTQKKATVRFLEVRDRYDGVRHQFGRAIFGRMTKTLEWHYRRRPDIAADSPKNYVQKLIYFPPGIHAWRTHIPGGFATYAVHNPDIKRMPGGKKMDFVTRRLFRHSSDGIGLRSRAYAMSWWVYQHAPKKSKNTRLRWLSIAAGTGQPTFDAGELFRVQPEYFLSDLSDEAMEFARELAIKRGLDIDYVHTLGCDVTDSAALKLLLARAKPDVIDMMGLVEYLDDDTVVALLRAVRRRRQAMLCFTNMRPEHPQLQTHQRGLGWPGIHVRSIDEVLALITKAGISLETVEVLLPSDKVYAIYCLS